ncbi:MAG: hypothetical protein NT040_10805 [Bacteroidetes bacterium]|nr:hypothetical protein [Bacteroidota bacterium]
MKKSSFFISLLLLFCSALFAQVCINTDNSLPDNSAMLDVKSTSKGLLIPRMTQTEIEAIMDPANGLVVFCTTSSTFFSYISNVNKWKEMAFGPNYLNPGGGGFVCGSSITINHVISGGAAPVDKTVTYGTVNNITGEPIKCWITSNLGADHQATALNDATEASAGWYWQFNRKQGYKHDGTIRTPNNTWIFSISENFSWQATNDPCNIEFGTIWRIPTYTEWDNVDNTGGWTNWNGPWESGLKLHAAGYLLHSNGVLNERGTGGYYWSSRQIDATYGWGLGFSSGSSSVNNGYKPFGFSVRCVRDN